ncbi:hypothetical protein ALQ04_00716 [Pseudomonas cichorii]|uniref:Hydrolase or acyltransferase n=1 Tax=Pseudomonas cichorii TaxID=36746 RepID=A0A3M4LY39_PSECI|nr:alpha/beta hydrolase family protein [Pseudomonas cichorii]RMQ46340.1 hypothetical protein ALQ04_00716 [Pseudomonas cichorii]
MSHTVRATFSALLLSLIVPCGLPALAADPAPAKDAASTEAPAERAPLLTRSQEDALALERQLPAQDLQQLQAGDDNFLALWKPANSADPQGAIILLPGAGESADWPDVIGPLRRKFPDTGWATLSITLPDVQDEALMPREPDTEEKPEEAPKDEAAKLTEAQTQATDETARAAAAEERVKAEAEHVFARIESAISFAQQNKARSIVLVGHSSGAYWAARFLNERQSPAVQKLVMVAAREPVDSKPSLLELVPALKMKTADFVYRNQAARAANDRLQASKRAKGAGFTQVGITNIAGNEDAEQEQIFRRIRGWIEAQ